MGSGWRNQIRLYLLDQNVTYYDRTDVYYWNEEEKTRDKHEYETCDFYLYGITPKTTDFCAIAEVVDNSNKRPKKTMLVIMRSDEDRRFNAGQWKGVMEVGHIVKNNGGMLFSGLQEASLAIGLL